MIRLDGSEGEGGGQILRSALALAIITGQGFEIDRIRAGRSKPGLRNQHLACVHAAQAISAAEVEGDAIDSAFLRFVPRTLVGGTYHFEQPGAGSAMLVLQTVLLPLLLAAEPSILTLTGGTHNPLAPPFDFISESFVPCLERMGARLELKLERAGFFPAGGGRCLVKIQPSRLAPLHLSPEAGRQSHSARILLAQLPPAIGERELQALKGSPWQAARVETPVSRGPGNVILLRSQGEEVCSLFVAFGEKGKRAEQIVATLLERARHHFASRLAVEEYLADQLLLPMAVAGGGSFFTSELSEHTRTNLATIRRFLELPVVVEPYAGKGKQAAKGWRIALGAEA